MKKRVKVSVEAESELDAFERESERMLMRLVRPERRVGEVQSVEDGIAVRIRESPHTERRRFPPTCLLLATTCEAVGESSLREHPRVLLLRVRRDTQPLCGAHLGRAIGDPVPPSPLPLNRFLMESRPLALHLRRSSITCDLLGSLAILGKGRRGLEPPYSYAFVRREVEINPDRGSEIIVYEPDATTLALLASLAGVEVVAGDGSPVRSAMVDLKKCNRFAFVYLPADLRDQ